jgi:biopolymer transport protein TolR
LPGAPAQKESDIMQFNTNDSGSSLQSEINITPLVDVVLVLLIIFMVVVPLLMEGYDVDIPRASANTSALAEEKQLILNIGATECPIFEPPAAEGIPKDCRVTLADQKIPATELPARVGEILGGRPAEQRALFLAVDDRLNYEGVLRIIDLAKSGVEDLKIEFIATN